METLRLRTQGYNFFSCSLSATLLAMPTRYILKNDADSASFKVDYVKELNPEQLDVVQHGEGPCLVLAGAGSGKTRTIVYRVAYLIEKGIKPENILLVTFTNKAAKEMLFRVEELLGAFPKGLWGGTFHHVANMLLRKYAPAIGYDRNFTILDEEDAKDLISLCVKSLHIDTKKTRFPSNGVIKGLLSLSVNMGVDVEELISDYKPEFMKVMLDLVAIAKAYTERKMRSQAMDFDDMLANLLKLLQEHEDIRQRLAAQFRYILVDEYQDTNHMQAKIVQLLSVAHHNILVVGDDAQSIYSFRGADIANILDFPKLFPNSHRFTLDINYRSVQPVLDVANEVIKHNPDQFPKKLKHVREGSMKPVLVPALSDEQEAEFITQRILELREEGVPLREIAVLFRAAYHSQALEFELTRRDIPYDYRGGLRFFDRAHIKDAIAHLKIVVNPQDEVAFLRVIRLQVGIGDQTASQIFDLFQEGLAMAKGDRELAEVVESIVPPARGEKGWANFRAAATALIDEQGNGPETMIRMVMDSDYKTYLQNQYPDWEDRMADLEQLALFAGKYDALDKFLSEVTLQEEFGVASATNEPGDREKIVLTTVHQAKGLEWRAVFVMHLSDGLFPNGRAMGEEKGMEEERRLFYVAVTRAKEYLYLSYSMAAGYRTMSMQLNSPSPFIKEIPHRLLEQYQLSDQAAVEADALEDPDQIIDLDDDGKPKSLLDRVLQSNAEKKQRRTKSRW